MRIWLSAEIVTPWIMADEFLYSEMAKSFAASGQFLVRDAPTGINNVVYPALISPAWLAHPMGTTYALAKAINVVVMTSTAIPLFLWARKLVAPVFALVAVALTLLMPAFIYTGMLMTENAFLPAFVLAAFAIALALERPTLFRQLAAFASILLAVAIRFQGLVFLAVLPLAILLKVLFELLAERRPQPWQFVWRELRRYWLSFALLVGGVVLYIGLQAARGRTLSGGLGGYQVVTGHQYSFGQVRHWVLLHFAELFFSVGMLPASAFLLLLGLAFRRGGTRSDAERAFLAVAAATVPLLVIEVAAFASRFSLRVEDRYMFFLAPLLFLAFVLWLDRGLPRPPVLTIASAVVPAVLLFALPLASLLNVSILSDTFGLIPLLRLASKVSGGIPEVRHLMLVGGIAAALFFVLWPLKAFPRVLFPSAVAAFLVLSSHVVVTTLHSYSVNLKATAGTLGSASWIDERIGSGGNASFLLGTTNDSWPETLGLWQNEFWNRSLGVVYNLGAPEPADSRHSCSAFAHDRRHHLDGDGAGDSVPLRRDQHELRDRRKAHRRSSSVCALRDRRAAACRRSEIWDLRRRVGRCRCCLFAVRHDRRRASRRFPLAQLVDRPGCTGARPRSTDPVEGSQRRQGAREAYHHASQRSDENVEAESPEPAVHRDRPHLANVLPIAVRSAGHAPTQRAGSVRLPCVAATVTEHPALGRQIRDRWSAFALVGLVLAAATVRIVVARGMEAPVILCDEFIYSNVAKNLAEHGRYVFRGVPSHQSYVYPLLIAPAWLFDSMATTYALAKSIGAASMTLVAVPTYLWARRMVGPWHSLLAAALTLLLPAFFIRGF